MKHNFNQYFLTMVLITLRTIRISNGTASSSVLPLWTWDCINERCVPSRAVGLDKLQSLPTCNMLCASMQLWPQPTGPVSLSTSAVPVRANLFQLQALSVPSKVIHKYVQDSFQLFLDDLKLIEKEVKEFAEWRAVAVRVTVKGDEDPRMRLDTDESYHMWLRPKFGLGSSLVVDIEAISFCGARHGLETLLQLVWLDSYLGSLLMLDAAKVKDAPRFNYRGLMLDTARNYFPVGDLMRTIDAMAASKLNTFHWHISDSQSFPLRVSSVPQLAQRGAYGPGALYSPGAVRDLVRRARLRGVRVLIEVDVPAHVGRAWTFGPSTGRDGLIYCYNSEDWSTFCSEPPCGQLNPLNPHVYEVLEALYADILQLTGVDDIFHIGGSDISDRCWQQHLNSTTPIVPMDLWLNFTNLALEQLGSAYGKLPNLTLLWSSRLGEYLKTDLKKYVGGIGVQIRGADWSHKYVNGIRSVLSHAVPWDLNSGMGEWYETSDGVPYNSWQRVYEHRPWTRSALESVVGGEATVWSSALSAGGLDARVWPRAAALAERLWSDRAEGATRLVHARLDVHRERLVARGIQGAPIWSMWCTHNTYTCG